MAALVDKSLVEKDRQTGLLRNELVVIVPADSDKRVDALSDLVEPGFVKLAIGEPATVPAGGYTREALEHYGLWDKLQSRFVYAKDVRQVLTYVETGNADAGFVYKTDALTSKKVKVASVVGPGSHQAIEYPIGIVRGSAHMEEAERFYDFLRTAEALAIFEKYGFSLPNERGTK
jgi:molybdate transport system substrate-binding protein